MMRKLLHILGIHYWETRDDYGTYRVCKICRENDIWIIP